MDDEATEAERLGGLQHAGRELGADVLLLPVVADDERHLGAISAYGAEARQRDELAGIAVFGDEGKLPPLVHRGQQPHD